METRELIRATAYQLSQRQFAHQAGAVEFSRARRVCPSVPGRHVRRRQTPTYFAQQRTRRTNQFIGLDFSTGLDRSRCSELRQSCKDATNFHRFLRAEFPYVFLWTGRPDYFTGTRS